LDKVTGCPRIKFPKGIIFLGEIMSGEIDRPGWVQLARTRQEPGSYEMQLVPEALNLIRAVAHEDQDIHRAIAGLSDDHTRALKEADTEESFKKAILSAFKDRSIYVVVGALGVLDKSIAVFNGRPGETLEEIFDGNNDVVSRVKDVKTEAGNILRQLRSDILDPQTDSLLVSAR